MSLFVSRRRALLALVFGCLVLSANLARAAGEFRARGFILPPGAVKIDDDRYRLPSGWDEVQRFYRNTYPAAKYPRHTLRNQAGVRAIHIVNPKQGEEWIGVNMYEAARGEVRVYVLGTGSPDADAK